MKDSIFYGRDEVAEILGYKSGKAYKVIRELFPSPYGDYDS